MPIIPGYHIRNSEVCARGELTVVDDDCSIFNNQSRIIFKFKMYFSHEFIAKNGRAWSMSVMHEN